MWGAILVWLISAGEVAPRSTATIARSWIESAEIDRRGGEGVAIAYDGGYYPPLFFLVNPGSAFQRGFLLVKLGHTMPAHNVLSALLMALQCVSDRGEASRSSNPALGRRIPHLKRLTQGVDT